jgi:hypothetical protein
MVKERDKVVSAIRNASTEDRVLALVREYVASLAAHELAVVPISLAAKAITDAQDVARISMVLAKHEMLDRSKLEGGVLKDAAMVFATASAQLSVLAAAKTK